MTTVVSTPTDRGAIREAYQSDGYVLVKGLISPEEAREMRQEVHDLFQRVLTGRNGAWESARKVAGAEGKQELQGMHDLQFYSAVFSRMLVDSRFVDAAAAALGVENLQLHGRCPGGKRVRDGDPAEPQPRTTGAHRGG
jgi:phytanoyl-CoA hydroxylase